jgi:hypothetical protein
MAGRGNRRAAADYADTTDDADSINNPAAGPQPGQ